MASLAATYGMPYGLHYTTSKAAVIGLTRGLARELGRDNIRVNAIAPSAVLTEGAREFFAEKADKALDTIRTGQTIARNLTPSDLLGAVHWLVSDSSQLVTGQTIAVDGGTVMHGATRAAARSRRVGRKSRRGRFPQGRRAFRRVASAEAEEFHAERGVEDRPGRSQPIVEGVLG